MVMPHLYAHLLIGDTSTIYYTDVAMTLTNTLTQAQLAVVTQSCTLPIYSSA